MGERQPERTVLNVRIGKPEVSPDTPSHTRGVIEGNEGGAFGHEPGFPSDDRSHERDARGGRVTARRSTGVNAGAKNPILPEMPNLPPA